MSDLRYAFRSLRRQPGFTLLAVAAMAVGIGANTAVFSVVHAVLLKSLPYLRPDELVFITEVRQGTANSANVPPANYLDYRSASSLQSIGAAEAWGATLSGGTVPEQVRGLRMTASLFNVLGVQPMLGRTFRSEEEEPGNDRAAVLTYDFWSKRFGGDRDILGRTITLNGETWKIVGVMPRDFRFAPFWATNVQMFAPLSFDAKARASRAGRSLRVFARLKPGVAPASAQSELNGIFARALQAAPENNAKLEPSVTPLNQMVVGKVRTPLLVLLAAVGLVLLIACANVATLILVRAIARRRDTAVRLSLGASRTQLLRFALAESACIAAMGGVAGLLLAGAGVDALSTWFASSMPRYQEIEISLPVLGFTALVCALSAVVLSLVSGLQVSPDEVSATLKESSTRTAGGTRWSVHVRRGLVITQVAFSVILLLGAGLLLRSLLHIQAIEPGFNPSNSVTASLHTWGTSAAEPQRQMAFYRTVLERVRTLPGVESVALINHIPLAGDMWGLQVFPQDRPDPQPGEQFGAVYRLASAGYFSAMQIPIVRGRGFTAGDVAGREPVVVINETMAKQIWPGEDAVGKRLRYSDIEGMMTVVGVVRDVVQRDWIAPRNPEIYVPLEQHPEAIGKPHTSTMTLVARTSSSTSTLLSAIAPEVAAINSTVPVTGVQTFAEIVAAATQRSRVYASLLGVFAVSALALAIIGLYGLVSYETSRRTQEIGVRMALGARPGEVLMLVLRDAMTLAAVGTLAGVLCSLVAGRWVASMLYGVTPADTLTLAGVTMTFAVVSCVAAYLPARRAARMDPTAALRAN